MQKKKNIRLLIIFLILVVTNLGLMWYGDESSETSAVDLFKFTLQDTVGIDRITLNQLGEKINLQKESSGWLVNESFKMNDQMRVLLLAVLSSLETKRAIDPSGNNPIGKTLKGEGVLVEVFRGGQSVMKFHTGGNTTKTVSYMMDSADELPYVVTIPGYSSFVAGLFALKEGDWRNKSIFNSSRNSFKSLTLYKTNTASPLLDLSTKGQFFEIAGIQQVDSGALFDYLQQTVRLEVDEFIKPGDFADYDSLVQTTPEFTLELQDFDAKLNRTLSIYPQIIGDHQRLIKIQPGDIWAGLRNKKLSQLIKDNQAFKFKR